MNLVGAKSFWAFTLSIVVLLHITNGQMLQWCEQPEKRITPKVVIGTKAFDDTPNDHLAYTFSSWSWNTFSFVCSAKFPIRWVFDYDQDDGDTARELGLFQSRNFTDFYDYSTHEYHSVVTFRHLTRVTKEQVYSCEAVSLPCNRRLVTSKPVDQGQKLQIKFVLDLNIPQLEQDRQHTLKGNETINNQPCRVLFHFTNMQGAWHFCCASVSAFYVRGGPLFYPSKDANTLENIQRSSYIQSEMCINKTDDKFYCIHGATWNISQPVGIACDLESRATFSLNKIYFGLDQDEKIQKPPAIYFDWYKINPETMMNLKVPNPLKAYANETVTIACYISVAYFSHGGFIATYDHRNNLTIYKSKIIDESTEPYIPKINAYKIEFSVLITKITERVYCFAPIWNTTEWFNKSVSVNVLDNPPLRIVNASETETIELSEENERPSLTCVANGFPTPRVEWRFVTKALTTERQVSTVDTVKSTLKFSKLEESVEGPYRCTAWNPMGEEEKLFYVKFRSKVSSGLSTTVVSSFTAGGLLIIGVLLSMLVILWRKNNLQRKQIEYLTPDEIKNFLRGTPCAPNDPSYNTKFETPRSDFRINETDLLGSGAFGKVYKGQMVMSSVETSPTLVTVAIKTVPENLDIIYFKALLSEIKIMASIDPHDNVVQLMGACTRKIAQREVYMAVEYCANGNLHNYLRNNRTFTPPVRNYNNPYKTWNEVTETDYEPEFPLAQMNQWAGEIAKGMDFLATFEIVHGDLAARNIFLSENLVAKIGDFGLARVMAGRSVYVMKPTNECPLPWKWMAIEALENLEFSLKSDVWSYGMVLWEIFSLGQTPYPGVSWTTQFVNDLRGGVRESQPKFASNNMFEIIQECWKTNRQERPTFSTLLTMLQQEEHLQ